MASTEYLAPRISACFLAVCLSVCVFICSAPDDAGSLTTVQETVGQRRLVAARDSIGQDSPLPPQQPSVRNNTVFPSWLKPVTRLFLSGCDWTYWTPTLFNEPHVGCLDKARRSIPLRKLMRMSQQLVFRVNLTGNWNCFFTYEV